VIAGYGADVGTHIACCGTGCGTYCPDALPFTPGMRQCSTHREQLCNECREIAETFHREGEWTGHVPGPRNPHGPRFTVCALPYCPELTQGHYCSAHRGLSPDDEDAEIRRLREDLKRKERRLREEREAKE
jgi:hypothetical protein